MRTVQSRTGVEMVVRLAARGDEPRLHAFNAALSEETRSLFLPHAYDATTLERVVTRVINGEDRAYLVLDGDTVAAYFFLWEFREPVPVLGIGVADSWQGQGLGAALMRILIEEARAAGRDGIELTTVPENRRAFALYQKMGFQHMGDTDNVAGDGRVVREHVMFLPLVPGAISKVRDFGPPA